MNDGELFKKAIHKAKNPYKVVFTAEKIKKIFNETKSKEEAVKE